jgi:predicted kinase
MFDSKRSTLIIVRGLPGAGKSTLAKIIPHDRYFEADMFFTDAYGVYKYDPCKITEAHYWCQRATRDGLHTGNTVIVANTFTTEKEIRAYVEIAQECNANFISLIVENRHGNKSIHNVPDEVVKRMKDRFSVKL